MKDLNIIGGIFQYATLLNKCRGLVVYLCFQGQTNCLNLTVEDNKVVIYSNKVFMSNLKGSRNMLKDLRIMARERRQDLE